MNVVLQPHSTPYFGQDFTNIYLVAHLKINPIYKKESIYDFSMIDKSEIKLLISRYPDHEADNEIIKQFVGKCKIISHLHLRYNFLNNFQKSILNDSLSKSDLIIANCRMLCDEYRKIFPKYPITYINNGVDSTKFKYTTEDERNEFRSANKIPLDKILLSYVGRFNLSKGFQILECILEHVSKSNNLFFITQSIYHHNQNININKILEKYSNTKMFFTQDIKIVRYSDISINTSLNETTSLVTLEALFSGTPVICTDVTEFYKELIFSDVEFDYIHKIKMPSRIVDSTICKNDLLLNKNETTELCNIFIDKINHTTLLKQEQRMALAARFKKSNFESRVMLKRIKEIYKMDSI